MKKIDELKKYVELKESNGVRRLTPRDRAEIKLREVFRGIINSLGKLDIRGIRFFLPTPIPDSRWAKPSELRDYIEKLRGRLKFLIRTEKNRYALADNKKINQYLKKLERFDRANNVYLYHYWK